MTVIPQISLENLLVRKITWFVITTTSAPLILSRAFRADHMTRIAYIYSRLPRTHSLTFWFPGTALSLSLHFDFQKQLDLATQGCTHTHTHMNTCKQTYVYITAHTYTFKHIYTNSHSHKDAHTHTHTHTIHVTWVCVHSATFFFPVLPFRLDLFKSRTQTQKFRQIPKETNNQHGRRHFLPRIHCYISVYWYLTWNT